MKIACYVRPFYPMLGGLEAISDLVSSQLGDAGHEVVVLTETSLGTISELDGRRRIVRRPGFMQLWREFRDADAVLFFGMSLRALPAALLSLSPVVLSHHGVYPGKPTIVSAFLRGIRLLPARCFVNICVSRYVARNIPGRAMVIHNAYDESHFLICEAASKDYDFGFCGRLVSEKGVIILLEAFAELCKSDRRLRLVLVGDGPERSRLEEYARSEVIEENVIFIGSKANSCVASVMTRCRVLVVPSICEESFGIVALEALASGCRVVVTRKGGLPEAVGEFGIVVDASPESLKAGMLSALRDSHHQRRNQAELRRYLALRRSKVVGRRYERVLCLAARQ